MRRHTLILPILTIMFANGCASVATIPSRIAQRVTDFVHAVDDDWKTLHQIQDARRDALKEELQADREAALACELAELNAEREALRGEQQYRAEALRADTEQRREDMSKNFDESVRTKLGLNLDQRVKMGQLQVDTQKLQSLTEERDRDFQFRNKLYQDALRDQELHDRHAALLELKRTAALNQGQNPDAVGCTNCATTANDCARPPTSALRQGPNRTQPLRAPVRQPLLSTEVPFMLPVTLEVGVASSELGPSQVRRQPLKQPCLQQIPCGQCKSCRNNAGCECPRPCGGCPNCTTTSPEFATPPEPAPPVTEPKAIPFDKEPVPLSKKPDSRPVRQKATT